jgi:hypothetical protein
MGPVFCPHLGLKRQLHVGFAPAWKRQCVREQAQHDPWWWWWWWYVKDFHFYLLTCGFVRISISGPGAGKALGTTLNTSVHIRTLAKGNTIKK